MAPKSRSGSGPPGQSRSVQISKALSWLLRHGAAKERIPMTSDGYVSMRDVLGWGKIKGLKADFEEIVAVVESNEKQRFGLRYYGTGAVEGGGPGVSEVVGGLVSNQDANDITTTTPISKTTALPSDDHPQSQLPATPPPNPEQQTLTQHALSAFHSSTSTHPANPAHYAIRAVQGHSIKTIESTNLLRPILLRSDPPSIPATCVHGTFRAAWPSILHSGGLKPMSRVHVHFAEGPGVEDVLGADGGGGGEGGGSRVAGGLKEAMERSQVVSGMRSDAEVLVYVDVRKSMEEGGMEWWRSENGVVLTEGVDDGHPPIPAAAAAEAAVVGVPVEEKRGGGQGPRVGGRGQASRSPIDRPTVHKMVPMKYWDVVVEVGLGLGVLWRNGEGVVREIPPDLLGRGKGKGKGKSGAGVGKVLGSDSGSGSGKGKPKLRVERGSNEMYVDGDDD